MNAGYTLHGTLGVDLGLEELSVLFSVLSSLESEQG